MGWLGWRSPHDTLETLATLGDNRAPTYAQRFITSETTRGNRSRRDPTINKERTHPNFIPRFIAPRLGWDKLGRRGKGLKAKVHRTFARHPRHHHPSTSKIYKLKTGSRRKPLEKWQDLSRLVRCIAPVVETDRPSGVDGTLKRKLAADLAPVLITVPIWGCQDREEHGRSEISPRSAALKTGQKNAPKLSSRGYRSAAAVQLWECGKYVFVRSDRTVGYPEIVLDVSGGDPSWRYKNGARVDLEAVPLAWKRRARPHDPQL
ncbi:hypothetical protein Bbelb_017490 [Branchiostoma belcheri]|nr:hypothetical protein Bbelb_017490 [Branchiostoma belcheri]